MKKKILFLAVLLSELVVMGCSFTPHSFFQEKATPQTEKQEESGSFTSNQLSSGEQETSLSGSYQATGHLQVSEEAKKEAVDSWIPEGYTGAIAVITEANSGDVVIQTGDQLLYRNEVYGFQILLGKDWKGVHIKEWEHYREFPIINFHVEYHGKEGDFDDDFPVSVLSPQTFYDDELYKYDDYKIHTERQNNKYFFRPINGGISPTIVSYFFPSLKCKKIFNYKYKYETTVCENWLETIFKNLRGFKI